MAVDAVGVGAVAHTRASRAGARWPKFLLRRFAHLLISVVILLTATFAMIHLIPGDPVRAALGPTAPPTLVAQEKHDLGLDKPLFVQYVNYAEHLATGHLGKSLISQEPVSRIIADRLPSTLKLAALAFAVTLLLAVPIGVVAAALTQNGRRRGVELGFTTAATVLATIPDYLFAVGLVFVFAVSFHDLPVAGRSGPASYVLPVLALALGPAAALSRIMRVEMLKVLTSDYMRTARGKRLPRGLLYVRHALPNALTATLTLGGLLLGGLLAGTVLVENVFAWPGLGTEVVQSVIQQDYAVVQAVAFVFGMAVLLINFGVDVILALVDPRSTITNS